MFARRSLRTFLSLHLVLVGLGSHLPSAGCLLHHTHLSSCLTVCALSSLTSCVIISHFFVLQSCHSDQLLASRPCVSTWLARSLSHADTHARTSDSHTLCCHFVCVCGEFPSSPCGSALSSVCTDIPDLY